MSQLNAWLESKDFYELCQQYRHAPDGNPADERMVTACEAFDVLKEMIRQHSGAISETAVTSQMIEAASDVIFDKQDLVINDDVMREALAVALKNAAPQVPGNGCVQTGASTAPAVAAPDVVACKPDITGKPHYSEPRTLSAARRTEPATVQAMHRNFMENVPGARAQGPCETTQTPRFEIKDCACGTYEGNLGPCLTWWEGNEVGRCVYCAHGLDCHVKLSKLLASEKPQADPKNANLAALVLKLDKHISLHEMFAAEWVAIVAEAKRTPSPVAEKWLVSCPWCGEQMNERSMRQQVEHLIDCGDKRIAAARTTGDKYARPTARDTKETT